MDYAVKLSKLRISLNAISGVQNSLKLNDIDEISWTMSDTFTTKWR